MTRFELIEAVRQDFSTAKKEDILRLANDLEHRLYREIFEPAGQGHSPTQSDDLHATLLASTGYSTIYLSYVTAHFALQDGDHTRANACSELFNRSFAELAVAVRRAHPVVRKTRLTGGNLL